jgi:hypothetical protein
VVVHVQRRGVPGLGGARELDVLQWLVNTWVWNGRSSSIASRVLVLPGLNVILNGWSILGFKTENQLEQFQVCLLPRRDVTAVCRAKAATAFSCRVNLSCHRLRAKRDRGPTTNFMTIELPYTECGGETKAITSS